jgi:hypothetical protein
MGSGGAYDLTGLPHGVFGYKELLVLLKVSCLVAPFGSKGHRDLLPYDVLGQVIRSIRRDTRTTRTSS